MSEFEKSFIASALVSLKVGSSSEASFTGLGKDELLQYANDPFWVRVRMILFVLFWVVWLGMLAAAIIIIALAPRCPERPDMRWYQKDVIYQVNPKSFLDTTADPADKGAGIGDLTGISQRLDYLESLGVNAFWINSFYKSGGLYDGTDVEDHASVDEIFGSKAGFDALRKTTKKKGMRMIVDFIPNHTGRKHEWFVKSQMNEAEYADYYIWAGSNCTDTSPLPNNWQTVYDTPAWTCDSTRKKFYYHSELPQYPDLNLRNEAVRVQMDGVLRYWLTAGVDGFYVRNVHRLVENNNTGEMETEKGNCTTDRLENLLLLHRWNKIVQGFADKPGREKLLMATVNPTGNNTHNYWAGGLHMQPTDILVNVDMSTCDFACLKTKIAAVNDAGKWTAWRVDSEDSPRFGSSVSKEYRGAFQALHLLLPGTALVYYGDEIAMTNGVVTGSQHKDPLRDIGMMGRDAYRTPMLWNNGPNAGFCKNDITPWLPVNPDYMSGNVEYNNAHMVGYTVLESFKSLTELRQRESFQWGSLDMQLLNDDVIYFTRKAEGFPGFLVAISRGRSAYSFSHVAPQMTLVYHSHGNMQDIGKTYDTQAAPIGFNMEGEVYVFEY